MPLNSLKPIFKQVKAECRSQKHDRAWESGIKALPEYNTWRAMKRRCTAIRSPDYRWYGARGIKICERWSNSFLDFFADMERKPSPNHSIDRIDNNGNYEPSNCKWSTAKEQCRNRRRRLGKLSEGDIVRVIDLRNEGKAVKWIGNLFNVSSAIVRRAIKNALNRKP